MRSFGISLSLVVLGMGIGLTVFFWPRPTVPVVGRGGTSAPSQVVSTVSCLFIAAGTNSAAMCERHHVTPLKFVGADADLLRDAFRQVGVPSENLFRLSNENVTRPNLERILADLAKRLDASQTLFVVFVGHGVGRSDGPALVLHDDLLSVDALVELLDVLPAGQIVLVCDACHSSRRANAARFRLDEARLRRKKGGLAWISSAQGDQEAYESPTLGNGIFTYCFADVLRKAEQHDKDRDGWLSLQELAEPVVAAVPTMAAAEGRIQKPAYGLVEWHGKSELIPLPKEWGIEPIVPAGHAAKVRIRMPRGLSARPWLIVAPVNSRGTYWLQGAITLDPDVEPDALFGVFLGTPSQGAGEDFHILLVEAGPALDKTFRKVHGHGLVSPALEGLPIRAKCLVRRTR
jgi:hypothetical protein